MQHDYLVTQDEWLRQAMLAKGKAQYLSKWQQLYAKPSDLLNRLGLAPEIPKMAYFPHPSFLLHIPFRLRKPYLSKDERNFYLLDNPLRREKVFQTPMVAATSWKGALRATLWQFDYKEDHEVTRRLLGNPRGSTDHQAGRLYFYPTFFDNVGLEVINPHNRETGVGERGPILMECVPQGRTGTFMILYVPFGPIERGREKQQAEIAQDLEVVAKGVQAMLTTYGFGAKTSSGFGTACDVLNGEGNLIVRAEMPGIVKSNETVPEPEQHTIRLPRYLESPTHLNTDFRSLDGGLKTEEEYRALVKSQGREYSKKERQLYDKAQKWWERKGSQLSGTADQNPSPEPEPAPKSLVTELTFATLDELCKQVRRVAGRLQNREKR